MMHVDRAATAPPESGYDLDEGRPWLPGIAWEILRDARKLTAQDDIGATWYTSRLGMGWAGTGRL